jgi:general secretion pathway protein F
MPIFQYKGYKPDGTQAAGTIEAEGLKDAIEGIKSLGVFPKDVAEHIHRERRWSFKRFDAAHLSSVTRQLSTLLSAGVPLIDAIRSLSEENTGSWRGLLVDVRERVQGGASLSRALKAYPKVFPDFYVNMVAAGEQSGSLDRVLVRVADYLEKQASIRSKIQAAMIYPAFMTAVGFMVMAFLFTFVVPKIVKIFENTRSALPFVTVVLIAISNLFVHYWWAMLLLVAALFLGIRWLRKNKRHMIDALKLGLPGNVLRSLYFGRFSRTLGFLLDGGMPMLRALELSARSVGNAVIEGKIFRAVERVAEGARLSASLEGFPSVLLQLIATGEKSGTMSEVLTRAAEAYEEDFERRVQKSLSLLEPVMILLMGVIVGFIVLAVLLPMFQLNQLVK